MEKYELATFAGGCFWCMVMPFDELEGVSEVISGYIGGHKKHPTYEEVCSGLTGHLEAVEIKFDPQIISFETLLDMFWQQIDPTDPGGQFCDQGDSYKTAIFYHSLEQKKIAENSKEALSKSGRFTKEIVTAILPASDFWPAEDYHQEFYKKNPSHYGNYRRSSGRDEFIAKFWSISKDEDDLRERLTQMQYHVTQEDGTEPAFRNEYWDEEREGIYVDVVSGDVLFTSLDKFDAGTGWPSFTKPYQEDSLEERIDTRHNKIRTEVRSKYSNSHLGHVFKDRPDKGAGLRYCINSAALIFIPKENMEEMGYGRYLDLFS